MTWIRPTTGECCSAIWKGCGGRAPIRGCRTPKRSPGSDHCPPRRSPGDGEGQGTAVQRHNPPLPKHRLLRLILPFFGKLSASANQLGLPIERRSANLGRVEGLANRWSRSLAVTNLFRPPPALGVAG